MCGASGAACMMRPGVILQGQASHARYLAFRSARWPVEWWSEQITRKATMALSVDLFFSSSRRNSEAVKRKSLKDLEQSIRRDSKRNSVHPVLFIEGDSKQKKLSLEDIRSQTMSDTWHQVYLRSTLQGGKFVDLEISDASNAVHYSNASGVWFNRFSFSISCHPVLCHDNLCLLGCSKPIAAMSSKRIFQAALLVVCVFWCCLGAACSYAMETNIRFRVSALRFTAIRKELLSASLSDDDEPHKFGIQGSNRRCCSLEFNWHF